MKINKLECCDEEYQWQEAVFHQILVCLLACPVRVKLDIASDS